MNDNKKFSIMKNGYNRYEVDEELKQLNDSLVDAHVQVDRYQKLAEQANEQLAIIKDRYQVLIKELSIREKAADDIARIALREANDIISAAQNNADSIVLEALTTARLLLIDLARIAEDANEVKEDMQERLSALQKTLDEFEIFEPIDPRLLNK
ncbi:MAG: DivIVA domain-containing protein [Erysipelotrichaceae bacterium]|nr:DivIVA domain-containing protein [Erysipelotrichaceae bacterium]